MLGMPLSTKIQAMGWGKIYHRTQTILFEGPSNPTEWWIYELAKTVREHPDAITTVFSASTLCEGFAISKDVFPTCDEFFNDVCGLITMLPIKDDDQIERRLLIDLLAEAARQCGTAWWYNLRERAALLFGVMHACMIERRAEARKKEDELGDLMGAMSLENKEIAVMNELVGALDGLNIGLFMEKGEVL
jgi:hypothetical protein